MIEIGTIPSANWGRGQANPETAGETALTKMTDLVKNAIAKAQFPYKLACLFDPAKSRYRVLYGGRGEIGRAHV